MVGVLFYIITRNDPLSRNISTTEVEPDENISLIETELTTIFAYINNTLETENIACSTLGNDLGYDPKDNNNFFDYYAPIIIDCLYEKEYPTILYDENTNYKIVSETELTSYENYFQDLMEFTPIQKVYTNDILNNFSTNDLNLIRNYISNEYRIAYAINNHSAKNNVFYEVKRIFKEDDHYIALISAIKDNIEYLGNLKIEVINNHCRFSTLTFY